MNLGQLFSVDEDGRPISYLGSRPAPCPPMGVVTHTQYDGPRPTVQGVPSGALQEVLDTLARRGPLRYADLMMEVNPDFTRLLVSSVLKRLNERKLIEFTGSRRYRVYSISDLGRLTLAARGGQ